MEGETAAWAARERTAEELEEMRAAVEDLRRTQGSGRSGELPDRAFHLAIARGTHNGLVGFNDDTRAFPSIPAPSR